MTTSFSTPLSDIYHCLKTTVSYTHLRCSSTGTCDIPTLYLFRRLSTLFILNYSMRKKLHNITLFVVAHPPFYQSCTSCYFHCDMAIDILIPLLLLSSCHHYCCCTIVLLSLLLFAIILLITITIIITILAASVVMSIMVVFTKERQINQLVNFLRENLHIILMLLVTVE
jgi:hypothetical protein